MNNVSRKKLTSVSKDSSVKLRSAKKESDKNGLERKLKKESDKKGRDGKLRKESDKLN
jgi:hypothetical protein